MCKVNQTWDQCGDINMKCQENCAVVRGEQPPRICHEKCSPGCKCAEGYVRVSDTDATCILREDCGRFHSCKK